MTTAQRKYWDFVGSLSCQLCGAYGVQISHSNQRRGLGQKSAWWDVAALCPQCHYEIDNGKNLSQWERRAQHDFAVCKTFGAAMREGILEVKK